VSRDAAGPLPLPEDPPGIETLLTARFLFGLDCFDAGSWHEAHEQWEELWSGEVGADRHLLQALIQLAVALHHRRRGNLAGTRSLLERAREHLATLAAPVLGVEPATLTTTVERLLAEATACADGRPDATAAARSPPPNFAALRAELRRRRAQRGLPALPPPPTDEG